MEKVIFTSLNFRASSRFLPEVENRIRFHPELRMPCSDALNPLGWLVGTEAGAQGLGAVRLAAACPRSTEDLAAPRDSTRTWTAPPRAHVASWEWRAAGRPRMSAEYHSDLCTQRGWASYGRKAGTNHTLHLLISPSNAAD